MDTVRSIARAMDLYGPNRLVSMTLAAEPTHAAAAAVLQTCVLMCCDKEGIQVTKNFHGCLSEVGDVTRVGL